MLPVSTLMSDKKCFEVKLFVDGCSRGNPGKAGAGCVTKDMHGNILAEGKKYLGNYLTNNQAEYKALIFGLDKCAGICRGKIHVLSDSELLVKHLTRVYRIRDEKLKVLFTEVKAKEAFFEKVDYTHIRREENKRADELANKSIDEFKK
ncbi:Bifunctional protein [subsurface metagenome]